MWMVAAIYWRDSQLELNVDRVELFRLTEIFRRHVDEVVIYFFNSDFKFFEDASEFSVTSLYVVMVALCNRAD